MVSRATHWRSERVCRIRAGLIKNPSASEGRPTKISPSALVRARASRFDAQRYNSRAGRSKQLDNSPQQFRAQRSVHDPMIGRQGQLQSRPHRQLAVDHKRPRGHAADRQNAVLRRSQQGREFVDPAISQIAQAESPPPSRSEPSLPARAAATIALCSAANSPRPSRSTLRMTGINNPPGTLTTSPKSIDSTRHQAAILPQGARFARLGQGLRLGVQQQIGVAQPDAACRIRSAATIVPAARSGP